ncbi:hypothetical protein JI435_412420 [Parastagonospora nodorum SN15]|uniref:Uncharacterized protein n=1 Tax=Phaeosphaeria nodorum (strain SN15 / ATCC MYA-4574 / FGSC 10173) TaxID=321614 RepID=A0A7U2I0E9_PHANO|nr:hypothetical protein JI435_412420 [Parastagonospora nodorum SN15]
MHSNVNPEPHGRWGGPRWVTWGREDEAFVCMFRPQPAIKLLPLRELS